VVFLFYMPINISGELPDGSGYVETYVGHTLGGINHFETAEEAENAAWSTLTDNPNLGLVLAEEAARAEREAQNPYARFNDMSYPRLLLEAIKSIRIGRPR
jgi:hypothetical protein